MEPETSGLRGHRRDALSTIETVQYYTIVHTSMDRDLLSLDFAAEKIEEQAREMRHLKSLTIRET